MTDPLARVATAAKRLRQAGEEEAAARREFEAAIRGAAAEGNSRRQIAAVAGVSYARVQQIIHEQ